jgi:hypothetical protein
MGCLPLPLPPRPAQATSPQPALGSTSCCGGECSSGRAEASSAVSLSRVPHPLWAGPAHSRPPEDHATSRHGLCWNQPTGHHLHRSSCPSAPQRSQRGPAGPAAANLGRPESGRCALGQPRQWITGNGLAQMATHRIADTDEMGRQELKRMSADGLSTNSMRRSDTHTRCRLPRRRRPYKPHGFRTPATSCPHTEGPAPPAPTYPPREPEAARSSGLTTIIRHSRPT